MLRLLKYSPKLVGVKTISGMLMLLAIGLVLFFTHRYISVSQITAFIQKFNTELLLVYFIVSMVRGWFLMPSTPFILSGVLLFPDQPFTVLGISMLGIMFSAASIYYLSDWLGIGKILTRKYESKIEAMKRKINSKKGMLFVTGWAFFPLAPTDLICFAAGAVRMKIEKFLAGIFIGELPIVAFYVFAGDFALLNLL